MRIPLTQGYYATIDAKDYELVKPYKWCYAQGYALTYVGGGRKNPTFKFMHRLINNTPDKMFTDHINGDKLDNRKSNLRNADKSLNAANSKIRTDNTSGHKGVWRDKTRNKWAVEIQHNNRKKHIGRFDDMADAIKAYNDKAVELFGEYARIN